MENNFCLFKKDLNYDEVSKLEQMILSQESNGEIQFRFLQRDDYKRGFLEILAQLSVVGRVTQEDFEKRFDQLFPNKSDMYRMVVIVDKVKDVIIGSGTVIIEKKFIRNLGNCGHIEDISVDQNYRGKSLGIKLIAVLKELAIIHDCYKVILNCSDNYVKFYEKNGFKLKDKQMAWYKSDNKM